MAGRGEEEGKQGETESRVLCSNKGTLSLMKVSLLFHIWNTQRTGLSGRARVDHFNFLLRDEWSSSELVYVPALY